MTKLAETLEKYKQERETCKQDYARYSGMAEGISKAMSLYSSGWLNKRANSEAYSEYRRMSTLADAELQKLKLYNSMIDSLEEQLNG